MSMCPVRVAVNEIRLMIIMMRTVCMETVWSMILHRRVRLVSEFSGLMVQYETWRRHMQRFLIGRFTYVSVVDVSVLILCEKSMNILGLTLALLIKLWDILVRF